MENSKMFNQLVEEGKQFLSEEFGLTLGIPIKLNGRLKSTLGRFRSRGGSRYRMPIDIELAKVTLQNGYDVALDVLKHELIHYALYELEIPNSDNDREFIQACKERNVSLTRTIQVKQSVAVYECPDCKAEILRRRKLASNRRYTHTGCKTPLQFIGKEIR